MITYKDNIFIIRLNPRSRRNTQRVNATYHWNQSSISSLPLRVAIHFHLVVRDYVPIPFFFFSSFPRRIPSVTWLLVVCLRFDRFYGPHRSAERPLSTAGRRTRLCRRLPLKGLVFPCSETREHKNLKEKERKFHYLISWNRFFSTPFLVRHLYYSIVKCTQKTSMIFE